MVMNVFDLAQSDTRLSKVSHKEYAGPCPGCGGSDRFHVQPDRKEGGAWMCRNCWPAESKGWADGIEYLRQFRKMSFKAAQHFLASEIDTVIRRVERAERQQQQIGKPPSERWQEENERGVKAAEDRLQKPEGRAALEYLLSRGLKPETIQKARLGYAVRKDKLSGEDKPSIIIPWYADSLLWAINCRDMRPDVPHDKRYQQIAGSQKSAALYLGDSLLRVRKYPVFIVEGELDALLLAQEAGGLASVVATGGAALSTNLAVRWIGRLARADALFIAYDRDAPGEKKAERWLEVFNNSRRWRPMVVKDITAMLATGFDIRQWAAAALEVWQDEHAPAPAPEESERQEPDQNTGEQWLCSVCGADLNASDQDGYYDEYGVSYCEKHGPLSTVQIPALTQEQFQAVTHRLAQAASENTGEQWTLSHLGQRGRYTLSQHVESLAQEQREQNRKERQQRTIKRRERFKSN